MTRAQQYERSEVLAARAAAVRATVCHRTGEPGPRRWPAAPELHLVRRR